MRDEGEAKEPSRMDGSRHVEAGRIVGHVTSERPAAVVAMGKQYLWTKRIEAVDDDPVLRGRTSSSYWTKRGSEKVGEVEAKLLERTRSPKSDEEKKRKRS